MNSRMEYPTDKGLTLGQKENLLVRNTLEHSGMTRSTDRGLRLSRMGGSGVVPGEMVSLLAESETAPVSSADPLQLHCLDEMG